MDRAWIVSAALVVSACLAEQSFATAQIPDVLSIDGKEHALAETPLEMRYKSREERPDFVELGGGMGTSACWRGYVATWELRDGSLFLRKLGSVSNADISAKAFPSEKLPLLADWYSGVLRIPEGEMLHYVHMGFGSVFERDRYILVSKGEVLYEYTVENKSPEAVSYFDRQRAELGYLDATEGIQTTTTLPIEDPIHGEWYDAVTLRARSSERSLPDGEFKVRGFVLEKMLWLPPSAGVPARRFLFVVKPGVEPPKTNHACELLVRRTQNGWELEVLSSRRLEPGEPINRDGHEAPGQKP